MTEQATYTDIRPTPFKPADLTRKIAAMLNTMDSQGATYEVRTQRHGEDNWSVRSFVTVTLPDGRTHRLRVDVDDLFQ